MVWGTFTICKIGDLYQMKGKLNQNGYNNMLQHHAIPSETQLVGQEFVLIQDNDPKHSK